MAITVGELLPGFSLPLEVAGQKVVGLTSDSRRVTTGCVFIAQKGDHADGRNFIDAAFAAGAIAVFAEAGEGYSTGSEVSLSAPVIAIDGLSHELGYIAARFYGHPARSLNVIAVTGTNGKTSFSHLMARALQFLHVDAAVIGTLGNGRPSSLIGTVFTTPDPLQLQGLLAGFCKEGITHVVMEASSHGLEQSRMAGVAVSTAVFTNLTRDHLDYHGTMESYLEAKRRLFRWPGLKNVLLNADDAASQKMREVVESGVSVMTYGVDSVADIRATEIVTSLSGLEMKIDTPWGSGVIRSSLLGRFNVSNLLAVLGGLLMNGYSLTDAVAALSSVGPVRGRMQTIGGNEKPLVVVDYAHTPDALQKVLVTLRSHTAGNLCVVFGCGGDRDSGKRPIMASIAESFADRVYVTNDNPRTESATSIIKDILSGFSREVVVQPDREAAICGAIAEAGPDDIVLLAGKGHEDYQEIDGKRFPFSDAEVASRALAAWGKSS